MRSNVDTAIILVSEITKGMKSIGSKALLNIDSNTTIIDHQIHYIKKYYNPNQIILCTGFDHDRIVERTKKYKNIKYSYNKDYAKDNQVGSLVRCFEDFKSIISNALIITNGLMLFNKIKIESGSSTYFIESNDKKTTFEIGTNIIDNEGYLFYDLMHKWVEFIFLDDSCINIVKSSINKNNSQLFLFELVNSMRSSNNEVKFIKLNESIISPIKVNSVKDILYAKKIYKKYSSVSY